MQDNDFSPDTIDAQTAPDAASLSAENARLVRDLRRLHQSAAASNAASLARVQARLREREQRALAAKNASLPSLVQPTTRLLHIKEQHHMSTNEPSTRSGLRPGALAGTGFPQSRSRWSLARSGQVWRRLSVIAASLLLVALVGSMAAVFALAHQSKHPLSGNKQTTISATSPATIPDPAPASGMYVVSAKDFGDYQISKVDQQTHEPLWTQEVGQIESSVVIYGNTIYVSAGDADYTKYDNYVYALDAQTGAVRWHVKVSHDSWRAPNGSGPFDLGVLTTPTVTGGILYVQARDGKLYALDAATGKQRWVYQAPEQALEDQPVTDPKTGQVVFHNYTLSNSNPVVADHGVVYGAIHSVLFAVEAHTGKQLWTAQIDQTQMFNTPQFAGGMLYLSSFEESNHSDPDAETGFVYGYTTSGKQQWKRPIGHWVLTDPIVGNGLLYFTSYDGQFHALKASDGLEAWHFTLPAPTWDDAILSDGVLYIDASWQSSTDAQGRPLLKTTLYALNPASGEALWKQVFDGEDTLDTVRHGVIYMGFFPGGILAAFSTKDGSALWQHHYGATLIDKLGEEGEPAPIATVIG